MELRPFRKKTDSSNSSGKCCKVLGCTANVGAHGTYCSRKGVCPAHLKADVVHMKGGGDQLYRFCQQCGKFEPLTCFIGAHRSCKQRLARRRLSKRLSRIATPQPAGNRSRGSSTQHTGLLQQQQSGMHSASVMQAIDNNMHSADSAATAGGIAGVYDWATLPTPPAAEAEAANASAAGAASAASFTPNPDDFDQAWHAAGHQQQHVMVNSNDHSHKGMMQHGVTAEFSSAGFVNQAVQAVQQLQDGQICEADCNDLTDRYYALLSKAHTAGDLAAADLAETAGAVQAAQQLCRSSSKGSNMLGDDLTMPDLDATLHTLEQFNEEDLMLMLEQELGGSSSAVQAVQQQTPRQYSFGVGASSSDNTGTALPDCRLTPDATLDKLNSADGAELQSYIEQELQAAAWLLDPPYQVSPMPAPGTNLAASAAVAASVMAACPPPLQALIQHAPHGLPMRAETGDLAMSSNQIPAAAMTGSSSCTPTATATATGMGDLVLPALPLGFCNSTADMASAAKPSPLGVHALLPARHHNPMFTPQYLSGQLTPLQHQQQQQMALYRSQLLLQGPYGVPHVSATCSSTWPMGSSINGARLSTAGAAAAMYPAGRSAAAANAAVELEAAAVHNKVDMLLARITHLQNALLQIRQMNG